MEITLIGASYRTAAETSAARQSRSLASPIRMGRQGWITTLIGDDHLGRVLDVQIAIFT